MRPRTFRWILRPGAVAGCLLLFGMMPLSVTAQLKTALEVRSLSAEEAETSKPVDLTAVVTFAEPPSTIFIQDETAGTFFRLNGAAAPRPGDEVRVRGVTFPGLYLAGIESTTFEVLSHRGVPEAIPATFDDLASGRLHYQRVAIEGVVRTLSPEGEGASIARVALGSRVIKVRVEQAVPDDHSLIDSYVKVPGLAAGEINDRRQLVQPYLRIKKWSNIEVLKKAPAIEETQTVSPAQLLTFDADGQGGHRVIVSGTVLAVFRNGEIFLRNEDASVCVEVLRPDPTLKPGDFIEVAGFPAMERFSASLVDATILNVAINDLEPEPMELELPELIKGDNDGNLVSVTAGVSDFYRAEGGRTVLVLNDDGRNVQAVFRGIRDPIVTGSMVRVTGICEVISARGLQYRSQADSVSLRIRSPHDIEVLRAPSWWTSQRMATVLIVLIAGILLAALWITLLRRQVGNQTEALRQRIENEAALEERQRLAREFHDTLEQDLAGLSLRLDAATARGTDDKMRNFLEGSRSLVSRIQTETRNLVSDLRHSPDRNASLEEALDELVSRQSSDSGPVVKLKITELPPMPSRTVHHLKMIAQEALTNAMKHAEAGEILIDVSVDDDHLVLKVIDDGKGFEPEAETHGKAGHFGCMGIRERCRKLGAHVAWHSEPANGSTVEIQQPFNP